jgi:hypothetical protein
MHQPVLCEPVESAMAMPAGRGDGAPADDLYALGACLMFLLLGGNPVAELDDEALMAAKMSRGSYAALLGSARVPSALVEPVRGLLADDPRERWTLQDFDFWIQGRRLVPRQYSLPKHATRPYEFAGQALYTARGLARALVQDAHAAMRTVKAPEFDAWLQRSLCEPERYNAFATALSEGHEGGLGAAQEERVLARICIALDPLAPIRFRGIAVAIDGFGPALAAAYMGKGEIGLIAEAMACRLPQTWFAAQSGLRPEHVALLKTFERLRLLAEDRRPGFGIERVLYELNPGLPCLSPLLQDEHVGDAGELLRALERVVESGRLEQVTLDRHIAAFLAARFRGPADWHDPLASRDPAERALGTLLILGRLQSWRGPAALPALTQRIAGELRPVVERFHNRPKRARLLAELPKRAAKGNLMELLSHIDSPSERGRDAERFAAAQREYQELEHALDLLRVGAPARPEHAADLGGRLSVTAATVGAWLTALGTLFLVGR